LARIPEFRMKLKKAKDGGCGTAATFVILCLLCCPALARKPTSTGASSAAVLLSSDSRDTERTVDESISNDTSSEPARPDYNSETPVVWLKQSGIPITVECLIAFCWIGMVASMPLIVLVLEGGSVTRTQIVTFTVMWLVLAGGVVLFHKVLLFQSSHFLHQRSLTLVECVYLMSQILTTVGYGDITPSTQRSQAVVAVYVIFFSCHHCKCCIRSCKRNRTPHRELSRRAQEADPNKHHRTFVSNYDQQ